MNYLVVGAGFAGAVYARSLAEAGHSVTIIDKRDHIGGNAFDFVDDNGVRVHRYGPHLFHTNNEKVVEWLRRFGDWTSYEHRVRARLPDGRHAPLPVNRETINMVFDKALATPDEVARFLQSISDSVEAPRNAAEYLQSKVGKILTDLFFRSYTKKMWALDLEDVAVSVVERLPVRFDDDDRYFPNDRYQMIPSNGYALIFEVIYDHRNINVSLNTPFSHGMQREFHHCFNSMPIDEYFQFQLGELPYRSIRFHADTRALDLTIRWPVVNFTDVGPYTRQTTWHALPGHLVSRQPGMTVTVEEPCDYKDNSYERYYPIKTADNRFEDLYKRYKGLASSSSPDMSFIGRCGTYQYLDMHQVINQSLIGVTQFLRQ